MMTDMYGRNYVMGRDRFFVVLRRHGLMPLHPNLAIPQTPTTVITSGRT